MRARITDEELAGWAAFRADDAGHVSRDLFVLRDAARRFLVASDAYDEDSKPAMDEWRAARLALIAASSDTWDHQ